MKNITTLNIGYNNIGDEGAKYISQSEIHEEYYNTEHVHQYIGDEGIKYISSI